MGVIMERQNWKEINGDETLALDWPLNEDSHVWEIGGYEGRWAQQIWDKFHCNITIFEPQLWAVEKLINRFKDIPDHKIEIRPHGLWTENTFLPIGNFHTDGASLVKDDGREPKQYGMFKALYMELGNFDYSIDVMLMNIEGAEYTLIPEMLKLNDFKWVKNFWCQFHPKDENDIRHEYIFNAMKQTHELLWDCYPTAVAWRRK